MVRGATVSDIPQIIKLLRAYSNEIDLECAPRGFSSPKAANIIKQCINLGLVMLYAKTGDMEPRGVVIGTIQNNLWSDVTKEAQMLAIYVKQEFRNTSVGGKLFLAYCQKTDDLLNNQEISMSHVFSQQEITNIDYVKRGFKQSQTTFTKEK